MPPKEEPEKMIKPKKRITEVYTILTPVSFNAFLTAFWMLYSIALSTPFYTLDKKWMVKSTAIPKAILKTSTVLGFKATLKVTH